MTVFNTRAEILDFIRELRAEGATEIAVGEVSVVFGSQARLSAPDPLEDGTPLEQEEMSDEEREKLEEQRLYWSADG